MWFQLSFMALVFSLLQPVTAQGLVISNDQSIIPVPTEQLPNNTNNTQQDVKGDSSLKFAFNLLTGYRATSYHTDINLLDTGKILSLSFSKEPKSLLDILFEVKKPDEQGRLNTQLRLMQSMNIDKTKKVVKNVFLELYKNDPWGILRREY